jgi:hypothetical protein
LGWAASKPGTAEMLALAAQGGPPTEVMIHSTLEDAPVGSGLNGDSPLCNRRQPRGRNANVHAPTGRLGQPLTFPLTPDKATYCRAAECLLKAMPRRCIVNVYRTYQSNRVRDLIEDQGAVPNVLLNRNCH